MEELRNEHDAERSCEIVSDSVVLFRGRVKGCAESAEEDGDV